MPESPAVHPTHPQEITESRELPPGNTPLGWIIAALVLCAAGGALALGLIKHSHESGEANERERTVEAGPVVLAAQVQKAAAERLASLPGEAHAFTQATLFAKVSGYVKSINVDKGDRVKKGQLIATLEAPDIDQQIAAAEADLAVKQTIEKRDAALVQPKIISQTEMDVAEANVKVARAALARLQAERDYTTIRAPFDGVITARYVDPGALVPAATGSTQAALPVVDLADRDRMRVYVYLSQQDAAYVHEEDPAKVVVDGVARPPIDARVSRLSNALDPRTRTMLCEIDLDHPDAVFPGSFVHVQLHLKSDPVPMVPVEALMTTEGHLSVGQIKDGRVYFQAVTPGIDDGRRVQILSGLNGGELIALNLPASVGDGARVQVQQPGAPGSGAR